MPGPVPTTAAPASSALMPTEAVLQATNAMKQASFDTAFLNATASETTVEQEAVKAARAAADGVSAGG